MLQKTEGLPSDHSFSMSAYQGVRNVYVLNEWSPKLSPGNFPNSYFSNS